MQHSASPLPPELLPYLVGLLAFCAVGFPYIYFSTNVRVKRIVLPVTFIILGGIFVAIAWPLRTQIPWPFYAIILAPLALQYRATKFCPRCGVTSRGSVFRSEKVCSKCSAPLNGDAGQ
jgi:hypothetical protein